MVDDWVDGVSAVMNDGFSGVARVELAAIPDHLARLLGTDRPV
jgi:hypothetical protein